MSLCWSVLLLLRDKKKKNTSLTFTHEDSQHISQFLRAAIQYFNANIKMLFVLCLFVVIRGSEAPRPFSIQPASVAQYRFYNRGKGQAFRDQTHLLIYSVYSISGLWRQYNSTMGFQ